MAAVTLTLPESFPFTTEIPVRITDINYGGHLGNDAVLSIIHEARMQFLRSLGYSEADVKGTGIIMTDCVIKYHNEGFYGMMLNVGVAAGEHSSRGCDIFYLLTDKSTSKEIARAKTGIVFFDYSTRKVINMPESFREKTLKH
jgi:acyl-CoA thioester hydrolase